MNYKEVKKFYKDRWNFDKKEKKAALKNEDFLDVLDDYYYGNYSEILYNYTQGNISGEAREYINETDIIADCVKNVVAKLSGNDLDRVLKDYTDSNLKDAEEIFQYMSSDIMQVVIAHFPEIKKVYDKKLAKIEKFKEIIARRLETKEYPFDPSYSSSEQFCRLPVFLYDKQFLMATIKNINNHNLSTQLINVIKRNKPELLEDEEIVAELIKVYEPTSDVTCQALRDSVINRVYNKAKAMVQPIIDENDKAKALQEKERLEKEAQQKLIEAQDTAKKSRLKSQISRITKFSGKELLDSIKEVMYDIDSKPLVVSRLVSCDILNLEELITVQKEIPDATRYWFGEKDHLYIERAYQIYAVVERFRKGEIKLKDIPASYFAFDDVVKEVTEIAKNRIKEQARQLTKDLNATSEVSIRIQEKISKKIQEVVEEITIKRNESVGIENTTIDSLDTKIEV